MKALSLTQPWATLVATGKKKVETRSWSTRIRYEIAIHAARGFPKGARDFAAIEHTLERLPQRVPLGAIIAVARIVEVVPTEEAALKISALERLYGDYSAGRYAWILEDVRALDEPIGCKGQQRIWNVPLLIEAEIVAQLGGF